MRVLMKKAMVGVVADEFADSNKTLKQLNAAALAPATTANREATYEARAAAFQRQATKLAKLGTQAIAQSAFGAEEKLKQVEQTTKKINDLTAQVSL